MSCCLPCLVWHDLSLAHLDRVSLLWKHLFPIRWYSYVHWCSYKLGYVDSSVNGCVASTTRLTLTHILRIYPTLSSLTVEYDCSTTLYFGTLRGEIFANLTKLTYLVMGDNSYNMASVPSEIVNLPNLEYLYMHNCDLQGNLDFVSDFNKIQEFWIDKNLGISGTIPTTIGQLSDSLGTFLSV